MISNGNSVEKIPSGIKGYDLISFGGIPKNRTTLIAGTPGSGKTIFCCQFLMGGILYSKEPGVFVTFEEPPTDIIANMKDFGWDIKKQIEEKNWVFVDVSPRIEDDFIISGKYDLSGLIIRVKNAITEIGAKRVVFDSLAALMMQFPEKNIIRKEIIRLTNTLKSMQITSLITAERYEEYGEISRYNIEDFVSDNVILLRNTLTEEYRRRTLEILKYRGTRHKKGQHSFTIKTNNGIVLISFERVPLIISDENKRTSSGISKLDEMIGGGFFNGRSILISGSTGTGKTLLSLLMINGGLSSGEKCLLFNLEESRENILRKATNWNINLEQAEKNGRLKLINVYPETEGIEELIVDVKTIVQEFKPNRIVFDSVSALERISSEKVFKQSLINLFLYFREHNVIGIFTTTSPNLLGLSSVTERHISTITDVIILLRYFESEESKGEIKRCLGIMKMRDSDHDKFFHEYTIDDKGINIGEPLKKYSGFFNSNAKIL